MESVECFYYYLEDDYHAENFLSLLIFSLLGYCFNGVCPTTLSQCERVWGYSGNGADRVCYEQFNTKGTSNGHCGKDAQGNFLKCEPEWVFQLGNTLKCMQTHDYNFTGVDTNLVEEVVKSRIKTRQKLQGQQFLPGHKLPVSPPSIINHRNDEFPHPD